MSRQGEDKPFQATAAPEAEAVVIERYDGDETELQETSKNCIHECVRPANMPRKRLQTVTEPAKNFAYSLDPFQKAAIDCLELGESVLVAAHTSAGKTTVAEYAIAMALRDRARVVYTSPIKALSNQKYRDLAEQFGDVGLMTGDVTLNPNASVIIMTTEILRSILYRGSELVREVRWVIFDEIHYMRDRDRGVVWEESIILLPDSVRQVFLSATIPNALEFAEWICRVKHQPCHVISTSYRPTPLQHFIFPAGGDGVLMVMDEKRVFKEDNFRSALSSLKMGDEAEPTAMAAWKKRRKENNPKEGSDLPKIIGMCHERSYTPVIVFAFSKIEVEHNALALDTADLTDDEEKAAIQDIFSNAVATLSEEDQSLPQIGAVLPLLMRGIGIHHGGLLPIVKEITELLFQELLIKVLFSTETFSMGINMPAKTVIFSAISKWDGQKRRMISPGEYIQMSGRAGRRGLDAKGLSIVMVNEDADPDELKSLFTGEALRLDSHFYLKYNTLLNLMRVDGADPQYMIQRSFLQFQKEKQTITLEESKKEKVAALANGESITQMLEDVASSEGLSDWHRVLPRALRGRNVEEVEAIVADFVECCDSLRSVSLQIRDVLMTDVNLLRFLQRGRILHVHDPVTNVDWGYGMVLGVNRRRPKAGDPAEVVVDVLLETSETSSKMAIFKDCMPPEVKVLDSEVFGCPATPPGKGGHFEIFPISLNAIAAVTKVMANLNDKSANKSDEFRLSCGMTIQAIRTQCSDIPLLDPIVDIKPQTNLKEIQSLIEQKKEISLQLKSHPLYGWEFSKAIAQRYEKRIELETAIRDIESRLHLTKHPKHVTELKAMEEVLRKLKYIDEDNVVTFKGRISCDISTVDELIIGEILFENVKVSDLGVDYLCAMLACLVHEDKPTAQKPDDPKLLELFECVQAVAKRIVATSVASRLEFDKDAYLAKFDSSLMKATLKWMRGESFAETLKETESYEGSVVRSFRRLEEVLRDLAAACKAIGSTELESKFTEALGTLKRGIVFAASLYL